MFHRLLRSLNQHKQQHQQHQHHQRSYHTSASHGLKSHTCTSTLLRIGAGTVGVAAFLLHQFSFAYAEGQEKTVTKVYSWGSSQYGQLGLGDENSRSLPTCISALEGKEIKQVTAGGENTAILTGDGEVYTWGNGQDSRTGHGDDINIAAPRLVEALLHQRIIQVACSPHHMLAVDANGKLYSWGRSWSGQLGRAGDHRIAHVVDTPNNTKIIAAAAGSAHTLALTDDGKVLSCGEGLSGALGNDQRQNIGTLSPVVGLEQKKVVQLAAGADFSLLLTADGEVYSMGCSDYGQTGHVNSNERYARTPKLIRSLKEKHIVAVAAGEYHGAALTTDGQLYTWGYGKDGQLGHGDTEIHSGLPRLLHSLQHVRLVTLSLGGGHTAAVDDHNNLYIWGRGRDGQLGRGDKVESIASYKTTPIPVEYFQTHSLRVTQVALGADHSIALVQE